MDRSVMCVDIPEITGHSKVSGSEEDPGLNKATENEVEYWSDERLIFEICINNGVIGESMEK